MTKLNRNQQGPPTVSSTVNVHQRWGFFDITECTVDLDERR
ncbi:hypothetical protein [Paucilactobacillus vaccinostercus]|nr:hypothetical protein [Paucilactobacillus vaccinostercus]